MSQLDIVIPVYNEGDKIHGALDSFLASIRAPFRLLICYDHDEDSTLAAIENYARRDQIEIELVKNEGKFAHGAVMSGFDASTAPFVMCFPADDTSTAKNIDAMVELAENGCDIVCASRFIQGGCMEGAPWLKDVLVRAAAFTLYHLARLPTHDATNGLRLFSRRVIDNIKIESTYGFCFSIELLVKCHRLGWRVGEAPSQWYERTEGQSRFRVIKWLPGYLRWYFYAFATTWLLRRQVAMKQPVESATRQQPETNTR